MTFIEPVAPLSLVTTFNLTSYSSLESHNEDIIYKFMLQTYQKLGKIAQDKKFKEVFKYMSMTLKEGDSEKLMYQVLSILSMP